MEATRDRTHILVILISVFLLGACSSRPCREARAPELDQTAKQPAPTSSGTAKSDGGLFGNENRNAPLKARVYKWDGSRQCERRGAKSVEATERELAGIPVYHREKRSDGLIHIQVCGSPTGIINIFEIDSSNLKQAEERGFKRWED